MEKIGLGSAPPSVGVIVRSFGIVLGLVVCGWLWAPWAAVRALHWSSIVLLATGGLLASFVGQLVFYHALKSGAVSQVTPVAGAYPLIAALLGWVVLREPITAPRLLGVVCVCAGVWLLRT
jgi:transporter family protein